MFDTYIYNGNVVRIRWLSVNEILLTLLCYVALISLFSPDLSFILRVFPIQLCYNYHNYIWCIKKQQKCQRDRVPHGLDTCPHCVQSDERMVLHGHKKNGSWHNRLKFYIHLTISNNDEPMQSDVLSFLCVVVYWYSLFWVMMIVTYKNIIFDEDRKI
jgi:hypothetical protein